MGEGAAWPGDLRRQSSEWIDRSAVPALLRAAAGFVSGEGAAFPDAVDRLVRAWHRLDSGISHAGQLLDLAEPRHVRGGAGAARARRRDRAVPRGDDAQRAAAEGVEDRPCP